MIVSSDKWLLLYPQIRALTCTVLGNGPEETWQTSHFPSKGTHTPPKHRTRGHRAPAAVIATTIPIQSLGRGCVIPESYYFSLKKNPIWNAMSSPQKRRVLLTYRALPKTIKPSLLNEHINKTKKPVFLWIFYGRLENCFYRFCLENILIQSDSWR